MSPRPAATLLVAIIFVVAACGSCVPSASAPSPSASPSAPPSTPSALVSPCPIEPEEGILGGDRLTGVEVRQAATVDVVAFTFERSPSAPLGSRGRLVEAKPPFSQAGSGFPITVAGTRFIEVRFDGMTLADESGQPFYRGERDIVPSLAAVKQLVLYDSFEGVMGWIVGFDGPGCVGLAESPDPREVWVTIGHP